MARLGFQVSARTVAKYMSGCRRRGPTGTWREFLTRHASNMWACDFFCVPTVLFQTLHVFFVIRLANREIFHVAVTRHPTADWAAQQIVECCAWDRRPPDDPQRYVVNMAKKVRRGRIFLDYLRNDRMATAVAPLSTRARVGATVSMLLTCSQVKLDLDPTRFTLRTVPSLIRKSKAWVDYCDAERPLERAVQRLRKARRGKRQRALREFKQESPRGYSLAPRCRQRRFRVRPSLGHAADGGTLV